MGVWSDPFHDIERARELQALLEAKEPMSADVASSEFYHLVGCDDMFDHLAEMEREETTVDARTVVVYQLHRWLAHGQEGWVRPWDKDAEALVRSAVEDWLDRHPEQRALINPNPTTVAP